MRIFVDIDQTLSTGHVGSSVQDSIDYYRSLHVEIPVSATRYTDFFQLPDVLLRHETLPGALAGVHQLSRVGDVSYATVRPDNVAGITRFWLREHGFPEPDQVDFCRNMTEKLLAIAAHPGALVLVDDRFLQVLDILEKQSEIYPVLSGLVDRLVIVAFGVSALPGPGSVVPFVPLLDWSNIDVVVSQLMSNVR
jgi:hypothetical protein